MTPAPFERIFASTFVGLLMALLSVVDWESVNPRWLRWPVAVLGISFMAAFVWWQGRPEKNA